jgi:geranylgeranyl diphosphate synthase type I
MSQSVLPPDVSPALAEQDVLERVKRLGGFVRHRLTDDWTGPGTLETVCHYAVSAPGKFFRPILLLESASAVGCDIDRVLPAAAGTEGAHVASLMHDDIIDGDTVRRGLPAVHVRFGRDDAIVGGDALIFYLFGALAACGPLGVPDYRIVAAMAEAARAGTDLCRGQLLEEEIRSGFDCRISSYLTMIQGKTGALFRASSAIGGILGGGSDDEVVALGDYGILLGYAFQISDDLLPYVSSAEQTGKPRSSDLANGRLTLPFLLCRESADPARRRELDELMTGAGDVDARFERLRALLDHSGALAAATQTACRYADEAVAALGVLPPSASRDSLAYFAQSAARRVR